MFIKQLCIHASAITFILVTASAGLSSPANDNSANNKQATKNSNVAEAQKLNGTGQPATTNKNSKSQELGGSTGQPAEKQKAEAKNTASVVNQVPGVKVSKEDLEPPTTKPIKGFHPIKKLLLPVENLEGMSIKLEQQIMKLEGPIAALNPPMVNLQKGMTTMHGQIGSMQGQITDVRSDLASVRKDIESLRKPIEHLEGPISGVSKPLEALEVRLNLILIAILIAALAIAVGTPVAAVLLYKHRHKLGVNDQELPEAAQPAGKRSSSPRTSY
jgi:predicted  nucleic acid-binding Zn-ribbon protein